MKYEEQKFDIPRLKGMSTKSIEEHLKLYSGYVKHTNLIYEKISELSKDPETNSYLLGELHRRFSFEWNGMRNHEHYFRSLQGGTYSHNPDSDLGKIINRDFETFDNWLKEFKLLSLTRGIGWAMLYFDPVVEKLVHAWVDEQHLGQLNGGRLILGLDMWEHSYVYDYQPSGKKQYVEDFFENLNWKTIEDVFRDSLTS